jgi:hypothetical protein
MRVNRDAWSATSGNRTDDRHNIDRRGAAGGGTILQQQIALSSASSW